MPSSLKPRTVKPETSTPSRRRPLTPHGGSSMSAGEIESSGDTHMPSRWAPDASSTTGRPARAAPTNRIGLLVTVSARTGPVSWYVPGSTRTVVPGRARSIAAWIESPGRTTIVVAPATETALRTAVSAFPNMASSSARHIRSMGLRGSLDTRVFDYAVCFFLVSAFERNRPDVTSARAAA
jgi:hypothetical protein